jgi:outer membrane protein TolC
VEAVKVSETSLGNAKRLLKINETRRDIGTAADIEVLQAKAGVSSRQNEVVNASARAVDAGDLLKQLLNVRDGERLSKLRIIPLDRPAKENIELATREEFDQRIDQSVAEALESRPELKMATLAIENADMDADRSRKDLLPQLDLTGSYSHGGRDHYLSDALYGTRAGNDTAFSYGIKAGIPLGNRSARGAYQRAEIREKQAEQQLAKTRTAIETNVQLAVRNLETNRILVKNSEQGVTLQAATVAAEGRAPAPRRHHLVAGAPDSGSPHHHPDPGTPGPHRLREGLRRPPALQGHPARRAGRRLHRPRVREARRFFEAYKVGVSGE